MSKRGISPLIAAILLVAFAVTLAALVSTYVINKTKEFAKQEIKEYKYQNMKYQEMAKHLLLDRTGIMELFSQERLKDILQLAFSRQKDELDFSVYRISHQLWSLMQVAAWGTRFKVTI